MKSPHEDLRDQDESRPSGSKEARRRSIRGGTLGGGARHLSANGWARNTTLETIDAALAATASERLQGDPLWLLIDLRAG